MIDGGKKSKAPKKKQRDTTPPKKGDGKKALAGHGMGGLFGVTPKKPEPDNKPQTRAHTRSVAANRLKGVRI